VYVDRLATLLFFYSEELNEPREKSIAVESSGGSPPAAYSIHHDKGLSWGRGTCDVNHCPVTAYGKKFFIKRLKFDIAKCR
jgi:hypothetical protein